MTQTALPADPFEFLGNDGEVATIIRNFDWSSTPIGGVETWSPNLKAATSLLLQSPVPIVMLWGEDGIMIYNDAYSGFAGHRHPALFGSKVREGWAEIADFNDNVMRVGLAGKTLAYRDQELTLHRQGVPEQVWMDLDYSPVPGEDGRPAGVISIVVETTERVLAERRNREESQRLKNLFEQALAPDFVTRRTRSPNSVALVAAESVFFNRYDSPEVCMMTPSRFRDCLRQMRWTSIDIVNSLQCELAWIEALEAGEIGIPGDVAVWLEKLASFHAKNSPPATCRHVTVFPKSAGAVAAPR